MLLHPLRGRRPAPAFAPLLALALVLAPPASAEEGLEGTIQQSASKVQADLQRSIDELSALRDRITAEKLPLTRELSRLEVKLIESRGEFQDVGRELDRRNLDLSSLRTEIKSRHAEKIYLSSLLDEYVRNLESRIHITELQRHRELIERARNAPENDNLSPAEVFTAQTGLVETSLDRIDELLGGARFEGTAVRTDGGVEPVTFALIGPVAFYAGADGLGAGLAEQRLGSLEPNMVALPEEPLRAGVRSMIASGEGRMAFDPTLGNARKMVETQESLIDHVSKGGPVMVPILVLAFCALVVALAKWMQISLVPSPPKRRVQALLDAVKSHDYVAAQAKAQEIEGPTGRMLQAGVESISEPKELVEELMFERMLETRLRLQSFLPFVAVAAAAAPLLGLLGTVTGIINTFKLITVFGTGDAKTLSSGISEALITTEFGLIVAIPSLLLHAFLSRKVKRLVDGMEMAAVSLLNRISPTEVRLARAANEGAGMGRAPGIAPGVGRSLAGVPIAAEGLDH